MHPNRLPDPFSELEAAHTLLDAQLAAAEAEGELPIDTLVEGLERVATALEDYVASEDDASPESAIMAVNYYRRALAGLDPDRLTGPAREAYHVALEYTDELAAYSEEIRFCLEVAQESAAAYYAWVAARRQWHEEAERLGDAATRERVRTKLVAERAQGTFFREELARHHERAYTSRARAAEVGKVLNALVRRLGLEGKADSELSC